MLPLRDSAEIEKELIKALKKKWGAEGVEVLQIWGRPAEFPKQSDMVRFLGKIPGPNRMEQICCLLTEAALEEFGTMAAAAHYLGVDKHTVKNKTVGKSGKWTKWKT